MGGVDHDASGQDRTPERLLARFGRVDEPRHRRHAGGGPVLRAHEKDRRLGRGTFVQGAVDVDHVTQLVNHRPVREPRCDVAAWLAQVERLGQREVPGWDRDARRDQERGRVDVVGGDLHRDPGEDVAVVVDVRRSPGRGASASRVVRAGAAVLGVPTVVAEPEIVGGADADLLDQRRDLGVLGKI